MKTTLRNALLALTILGTLALGACKSHGDTASNPPPAAKTAGDQPMSDQTPANPQPAGQGAPTTPTEQKSGTP